MKLNSLNLTLRFMALIGALILVTAVSSQIFFAKKERADLDLRLREKAQFLNNFYAFLISDALQRNDDITLQQVINRLEEDPEITLVVVVDQSADIRYHPDAQKVATTSEDPLIKQVMESADGVIAPFRNGGGQALALVSPLKVAGSARPIGAVRIELTYQHIEKQVARSVINFLPLILGLVIFAGSLTKMFLIKWVQIPLELLRTQIAGLNPTLLDATLSEAPDEFGKITAALNDFLLRFREQTQTSTQGVESRLDEERLLFQNLIHTLVPEARVIMADKDNLIVSDTQNGVEASAEPRHLLDLISDTNFANLVRTAFQGEGTVVRGEVAFDNTSFVAAVLSLPAHQAQQMKTLIALQPK